LIVERTGELADEEASDDELDEVDEDEFIEEVEDVIKPIELGTGTVLFDFAETKFIISISESAKFVFDLSLIARIRSSRVSIRKSQSL